MNAFKSALAITGIAAVGIGAYAIASPALIPFGIAAFVTGAIGQIRNQK